jgi:hypothetical protein
LRLICSGPQAAPGSFERHVTEEQNPNHYVFLLRKLELQPAELDSSQEAYVRAQVAAGSIEFLPSKAICMESRRDDNAGDELKVGGGLDGLRAEASRGPRRACGGQLCNLGDNRGDKDFAALDA